jgi:hypothetical protein
MAESIHVQGEAGTVIKMDLPVPSHIAQRLEKGQIRRVNADGSPYIDQEPTTGPVPGPPLTQPAQNANKSEWVGWAVVCGATAEDAEAMTKVDLVAKYGTPPPA